MKTAYRSFSLSHNRSGLRGPQFLSSLPKRVELCIEMPYQLVYHFGAPIWAPEINKNIWSSLFLYFFIKLFLFTRKLAYIRIKILSNTLKWLYCWKSRGETFFREHSYFGVTHCENSEVQIAVFFKWNVLREWKLVKRFTFCLSLT